MDNARPPTPTMSGPDIGEHAMSLTQQPSTPPAPPQPKRRTRERLAVAAASLVTVLAAVGIGAVVMSDGDPAPTPAPSPSAVAPSSVPPTVGPAPQTAEDVAAAEATERYREYLRVRDVVGQGGYVSSDPFDAVTVVPERNYLELAFRNNRQAPGTRQVGDTILASLAVAEVALDVGPGKYPKVVLETCLDVSDVDIIDGSGQSLVAPARVDRSRSTVTLYKYEVGTPRAEAGGWFVYEATSRGEPC